jgi:hypothetical protein
MTWDKAFNEIMSLALILHRSVLRRNIGHAAQQGHAA